MSNHLGTLLSKPSPSQPLVRRALPDIRVSRAGVATAYPNNFTTGTYSPFGHYSVPKAFRVNAFAAAGIIFRQAVGAMGMLMIPTMADRFNSATNPMVHGPDPYPETGRDLFRAYRSYVNQPSPLSSGIEYVQTAVGDFHVPQGFSSVARYLDAQQIDLLHAEPVFVRQTEAALNPAAWGSTRRTRDSTVQTGIGRHVRQQQAYWRREREFALTNYLRPVLTAVAPQVWSPTAFGEPQPSEAQFWVLRWNYNPSTGQYESAWEFDQFAYNHAMLIYNQRLEAHRVQQANEQAAYEHELDQYNQEVRDFEALQLQVKKNNVAYEFVTDFAQVQRPREFDKRRRRKDSKQHGKARYYAYALTRLVGKQGEGLDIFFAFMDNLQIDLEKYDASSGNARGPQQYIAGSDLWGYQKRRAANYLEAYHRGALELDWQGFLTDLALNEIEDRAIGAMGKEIRRTSRLTGRPVGLTLGPAL